MNLRKKLVAMLILACLIVNAVPAAFAVDTDIRVSKTTDYSELKKQVAIANGLNSYDYTIQTWTPVKEALKKANSLLKGSHGQKVVNDTTAALSAAIDGLKKMDYSELDALLADAYNLLEEDSELYDLWHRLTTAVEKARPRLVGGNQELVDLSVEELQALMEEFAQYSGQTKEPQVVVQEVEVEVLPKDDYCNIPMHRTWPVLFVISAVLNVALIVVLTYVIMKKRNTVDNTPLVSYDIDDDMDL